MLFIDSHAHLGASAFDADRDAVIARARDAGTVAVVCIGESHQAAAAARVLADTHPGFIHFTAGIHPHDAAAYDPTRDPGMIAEMVASGAVAVGECGLDYHYDHSPRQLQRRAFADQLRLARELSRPVVVHTRDAEQDTMALMREAAREGIMGVLHCFTGSAQLAHAAIEAGWYISLSGIITFSKYQDAALLRELPLDRLLVESDSPYLAPVPRRGHRNEPAWVAHTIARLAQILDLDAAVVAQRTSRNAMTFFGVAVPAFD
jgi:TatD DNase family protein